MPKFVKCNHVGRGTSTRNEAAIRPRRGLPIKAPGFLLLSFAWLARRNDGLQNAADVKACSSGDRRKPVRGIGRR